MLCELQSFPLDSRRVLWSHPAFANRAIIARNDDEIICVPLAAPK